MNPEAQMERARLLLSQNRVEQAADLFRQVLASDPNVAEAHSMLALCLTQDKDQWHEATREAEAGVHLQPDSPFAHYVLAATLEKRNHFKESLESINEAIQLDPYDADFHALAASVHAQQHRWQEALESASTGLEMDPEHESCTTMRALSLERLGQTGVAMQEATEAVRRNPDSADAHAMRGWAQLNEGDHQAAQESFREALRLDPTYEFARTGMIQSLNSNRFVFRMVFRFYSLIGRLGQSAQWAVIIGMFIGMRVLRTLANEYPALQPFVLPISLLYIGFCLLSWVANPLFNTFLRFHPFGRFLLSKKETWASNSIAACILLGVIFAIYRASIGDLPGAIAGGLCAAFLMMPIATAFEVDVGWPLVVTILFCLGLGACAFLTMAQIVVLGEPTNIALLYFFGLFIFSFVGNALRQVTVRH